MNKRLSFRHIIGIIILILTSYGQVLGQSRLPNIILITADDLGFEDLSVHGNPHVKTPSIDQLANQSVQFSDFSVTPVCATTRASLLTGRDFYKTGVSGVHGGRDYMGREETLVSEHLQAAGYRTGFWGKWHTGKSEGYLPWERGFDEGYYAELYQHRNSYGYFNGDYVQHDQWVSATITDYAINFIRQSGNQPFFAYLSYLAPHEPWLAPKTFVEPYLKQGHRKAIANLYGMIAEMDFHIGRLMQFLKDRELERNTLVIFLSDNGPWWDSSNLGAMTKKEWSERNPGQLRGNKGQTWQNGIKSPLFVRWQDAFKPAIVNRYVDVKDIVPTLLEIAKYEPLQPSAIDGQSFLPYLNGNINGNNTRITYLGSHDVISAKKGFNQWTPVDAIAREAMRFEDQIIGIRTESHKLLLNPAMDRPGYPLPINNISLFDMQKDPQETRNIASQLPNITRHLTTQLQSKFEQLKRSPKAYRVPVFDVDEDVSVINASAPASTFGETVSAAHHLTNLHKAGDGAEYWLNVKVKKRFNVYLQVDNVDGVGIKVKMQHHDQQMIRELNAARIQPMGSVLLATGRQKLVLSVLANNSYKPWTKISRLRRIFLVPADSPLSADDLVTLKMPY